VVKTEYEIRMLEISSQVSAEAHKAVMGYVKEGLYEYNAEARFNEYTGSCGLSYESYLPIVGAGYSSAILHYIDNNALMNRSNILLIDAASSYYGYASDITRTYPVCGCFTSKEKIVYDMVLSVQEDSIRKLRVGADFNDISYKARELLLIQLVKYKFLVGSISEMLTLRCDTLFMNHGLGHFVGLDVHDPGSISAKQNLTNGMVLTVEPGIYFNYALLQPALDNSKNTCYKFMVPNTIQWYLQSQFGGVRIEDVVLVQNYPVNYRILSEAAPKTISKVESASGCHLKCVGTL
jgi:Xaa-Pro aminopeptidase